MATVPDDDNDDGMVECENCSGRFDTSDMDGEHCRECAAEIFDQDAE